MLMRQGNRGANQFQEYLSGLNGGPGRLSTDRAGIGMPGYRTAVDPSYKGGEFRDYQPNVQLAPTPRENRRQTADTYFAYFSERNPRKRAELLKELRQVRREPERAGGLGGAGARSPSRVLDSAMGTSRGMSPLRRAAAAAAEELPSRSGRAASPARAGGGSSRPMPPPPAIPSFGPSRTTGSGRSRTTPSRVLERAGGMDDRDPGSTSTTPRPRQTPRPTSPPPPSSPE
jgi:hypothetical protein